MPSGGGHIIRASQASKRREAERQDAERLEAQRLEAERAEKERIAKEAQEAWRSAYEHREVDWGRHVGKQRRRKTVDTLGRIFVAITIGFLVYFYLRY